jgi:hypothetical protein
VIICFGKKALNNVIKKLLGGRVLLTSDCRVFSYKYNSVDRELNHDLQGKTVGSDSLFILPHNSISFRVRTSVESCLKEILIMTLVAKLTIENGN